MHRDPYELIPNVQKFLRAWDPIGVFAGADAANREGDEYDSYAPRVLAVMMRSPDVQELAACLENIRTRDMALGPNKSKDRDMAAQLLTWWQSVERET